MSDPDTTYKNASEDLLLILISIQINFNSGKILEEKKMDSFIVTLLL